MLLLKGLQQANGCNTDAGTSNPERCNSPVGRCNSRQGGYDTAFICQLPAVDTQRFVTRVQDLCCWDYCVASSSFSSSSSSSSSSYFFFFHVLLHSTSLLLAIFKQRSRADDRAYTSFSVQGANTTAVNTIAPSRERRQAMSITESTALYKKTENGLESQLDALRTAPSFRQALAVAAAFRQQDFRHRRRRNKTFACCSASPCRWRRPAQTLRSNLKCANCRSRVGELLTYIIVLVLYETCPCSTCIATAMTFSDRSQRL